MSVCVCLVGFASLQSTWAHTLRHPCLACSSRCTEYCHSHNNCKKTIIPQKSPSHLPPLSKGGGLTAKHKLLLCCVLIAISTPFLSPNLFAVKTEGLLHPLAPHQPFQTRTIPPAFRAVSSTAPFTAKIKSAPVFTGANSSSH